MQFNTVNTKIEEIKQLHGGDLMEEQNIADEVTQYKELLDEGIITEKEFSIKEKE